jgi:hypothetical protein
MFYFIYRQYGKCLKFPKLTTILVQPKLSGNLVIAKMIFICIQFTTYQASGDVIYNALLEIILLPQANMHLQLYIKIAMHLSRYWRRMCKHIKK